MKRLLPFSALALAALTIAACGGSSSSNTSGSGGSSSAPASSATVSVKSEPGYGKVLVNSSGQALYIFSADPSDGSKCTASCTQTWQPVKASGSPTAGPGANGSLLSSFSRSDGGKQVAYDHHALYTYTKGGLVSGEGVASGGGVWYLMGPDGKPVTKTQGGGY